MCNEQGKTIKQVWDDSQLKLAFRRNFSLSLVQKWYEFEEISSSITYTSDTDIPIWQFENGRKLHFIFLLSLIMEELPLFWQLHVSPRLHIFLWLLAHNKLMTIIWKKKT
jgi:hypothetical protein